VTDRTLSAFVGVLALCAVVSTGLLVRRELRSRPPTPPGTQTEVVSDWRTYTDGGIGLGPVHARLTVVEFSDFQCPFCKQLDSVLSVVRHRWPESIRVLYRHYPLQAVHPFAYSAATAAECAARIGMFEPFHDALFRHQDSIGIRSWGWFARASGIADTAAIVHCTAQRLTAVRVQADIAAGERLGVVGTPTLLLDSLRITGVPPLTLFERILRPIHDQ